MPQSTGQKEDEEIKKKLEGGLKIYTPDEMKAYAFYIDRIRSARDQREASSEFFDGIGYSLDYKLNRQAANTYLRPKLNDDEVRISSGTTEKKIEVVHNELMAMNFQHEVEAFTSDDIEISELGDDMADMVTRTNQIEKEQDVMASALWEMLTQRASYLEENFVTRKTQDRTIQIFQKRQISGLKVFLGDITIPLYRINEQPYICYYDRITYKEAQTLYGDLPLFKHIKPGCGTLEEFNTAFDFRVAELDKDEVEVIRYESFPDNECMLMINGLMMYKPGTKEAELPYKFDGYKIRGFGLKPMSIDFAYAKPLTASAKVLEAVNTETLRAMIRKWRQAIEPPLALRGKKIYSRDIFQAGAMTPGLRKEDFESIITHQGVTQSEIGMYELIQKKTEEFIGAGDMQQGLEGNQKTATETMELQKNFLKSLGWAVLGAIRMREEMTYLRIYNILQNGLDPIDKRLDPISKKTENIYRKFTLKGAELDGGRDGTKIIGLNDKQLGPQEIGEMYDYEKEQEKLGKHVRVKSVNINMLRSVPIIWETRAVAKQRDSSSLDRVMFSDRLNQAIPVGQIAQRTINGQKLVEDFERTWGVKEWFNKIETQPMQQPGMQPGMEQSVQGGSDIQTPGQPQKPSLNTLLGQAL